MARKPKKTEKLHGKHGGKKTSCSRPATTASKKKKIQPVVFDARVHLPLVERTAKWLFRKFSATVEFDDLISDGHIGLLDAIEKFQPKKGWQFNTYATNRIKGAMLDGIRKRDYLTRPQRIKNTDGAVLMPKKYSLDAKLLFRNGRNENCTFAEIIKDDGVPAMVEKLGKFLDSAPQLKKIIKALPIVEAVIVRLYFGRSMKMWMIAEILGFSEARVSQLLKIAIDEIRDELAEKNIKTAREAIE